LPDVDASEVPARVAPEIRVTPIYEPHVAPGAPAQNLHYAAVIARATGAAALASRLEELSNVADPVEPKFATSPASPDNL